MSPDWWAALSPAETQISCGDSRHRLRWSDGTLQAIDHPDAEGELVLAALGGEASPCLDLVMAWGRHSDDLNVLAAGPRSADDRLTVTAGTVEDLTGGADLMAGGWAGPGLVSRNRPQARSRAAYGGSGASGGFYRSRRIIRARQGLAASGARRSSPTRRSGAWSGRPSRRWPGAEGDPARADLPRLLALGAPFQLRLSGTVAHAWSASGQHAGRGRAGPALTAALAGRLGPAAAQWLGIDAGDVAAAIHDDDGWGQLSLAGPQGRRQLIARLPVSWLAGVWAPGLAVVSGHLVVSVLEAAWPQARVLGIRAPGRDPAELTVRQHKGHWSVAAG